MNVTGKSGFKSWVCPAKTISFSSSLPSFTPHHCPVKCNLFWFRVSERFCPFVFMPISPTLTQLRFTKTHWNLAIKGNNNFISMLQHLHHHLHALIWGRWYRYSLNWKDLKITKISRKDLGEWQNFGSFVTLSNL